MPGKPTVRMRRATIALAIAAAACLATTGAVRPAGAEPPISNAPSTIPNALPLVALSKTTTPTGPDMAATAHIYTADPAERAALVADGWQLDLTSTSNCDGVVGHVYDRPVSGSFTVDGVTSSFASTPLHRLYHPSFNSYYLVLVDDPVVLDNLAGYGFQDEGAVGHAFAEGVPGTDASPTLTAYKNATTDDYVHSIVSAPAPGYTVDRVAAYLVPDPSATGSSPPPAQLCPVSMLTQSSGGTTLYYATTDLATRTQRLADGWTPDATDVPADRSGVIGYLWDVEVPGTAPVHRFFHPTIGSYYYEAVTDAGRIDALAAYGFVADGPPIGYGFATRQPQTRPLTALFNSAGQAYYATTTQGEAWATQHGYAGASTPVHLFTESDPAVPYYEILQPTSGASRGVILSIHGGGWKGGVALLGPPFAMAPTRLGWMAPGYPETRDRYRALGWTIYNVDYHSGGARAYADLQVFYDELREQLPSATMCAAGGSAGAHLSLLLAATNDDLDCAIALAGPTNLATDAAFTPGAAAAITAAFGPEGDGAAWAEQSPALRVGSGFAARTFLRVAANDSLVASSQLTEFAEAVAAVPGAPAVDHQVLAAGGQWCESTFFIHACVTDAAYDAYLADETAFLNSLGAG